MDTKEALTISGSIVGLLAAVVTVIEQTLRIRDRLYGVRERNEQPSPDHLASDSVYLRLSLIPSYLFREEIALIVGIGIAVNYVGLALSLQLKSVLYLDMSGTAVTSLLLGPWWGAVTGLLSNFVNWLLYPESHADVIIFPWCLVNMAGGLFWGFMASRKSFKSYLQSTPETLNGPHLYYLVKFGLLGAGVMAIVGTGIQAVLAQKDILSLNAEVASAIDRLRAGLQGTITSPLKAAVGVYLGGSLAWAIPSWLQNWLRYIPDKTISAAIGLAIIKYGLPLFKQELILGGSARTRPTDNWVGPVALGLIYAPFFIVFMSVKEYRGNHFWALWTWPWLIIGGGLIFSLLWGPSRSIVAKARTRRSEIYHHAFQGLRHGTAERFPGGLWFATMLASTFFVLGLPLLGISTPRLYRVALNFFCVLYGFLFAMQLIFIMVGQNIGVSLMGGYTSTHPDEAQHDSASTNK